MTQVFNRDCMEAMKEFPDKFFELAIVDPPYGIGAGKRVGSKRNGLYLGGFDSDTRYKTSEWDNAAPESAYFEELKRVSKNQIVWGGNYFTDKLSVSRGWIFWDKKPLMPNYSDGELAWSSFNCVLRRIEIMWMGKIRSGIEKGYIAIHPTQKPIALYKWLLKNYAKEGDKILDTHLGSGSSRIAADQMGFDFWGYELDKDYFDASVKRFNQYKAQTVLF